MRRQLLVIALLMLVTVLGGMSLMAPAPAQAQTGPTPTATLPPAFRIVGEIGRALPRKFIYDPNFEQMAIVDAYSRLLLIDARTYATLEVLHERGQYADIQFSHDGRYLAVLYGLTVELWDTQTRSVAARLVELGGIRDLLAPVTFSEDDELLLFFGSYPAPRALRVTENQRITYPWVWHLGAARGETTSTLPGGIQAVQMFDYPNGFSFAPGGTIVAALPSRLRVLDADTLEPGIEIPTARFEQDPLTLYNSLLDDRLYYRDSVALVQVDPLSGESLEVPLGSQFDAENPEPPLDLAAVSPIGARVIGNPRTPSFNPLHAQFLGTDYRDAARYGTNQLTITLIDLVQPPVGRQDSVLALIKVEDHTAVRSFYQLTSANTQQMTVNADASVLLVRLRDTDEVVRFNLATGERIASFLPALRMGRYNRAQKNRVLAYDLTGEIIVSDFERRDTRSQIVAQDLRYSRAFDRFFFAPDNESVVTLAGTEWRQWSVATGEVIRREVVTSPGYIVGESDDGFRFVFQFNERDGRTGMEVLDFGADERYRVVFDDLPGHTVEQVIPSPSWTRFLVVYDSNYYGPYYPGNQIALYDYQDGFKWLIAGDDLPSVDGRGYRWVDDETVAVIAPSLSGAGQERIYGVEYAPNSLPQCLVERFPDSQERLWRRWEYMVWLLPGDDLNRFTQTLCGSLPASIDEVVLTLVPSPTPARVTATPLPNTDPIVCLQAAYPNEIEDYSALWTELSESLTESEQIELTRMLCEGVRRGNYSTNDGWTERQFVMLIDAETGMRAAGNYVEETVEQRPLGPIYELFQKTENRSLGTALLSQDQRYVASSSLPGELVVYELLQPYQQIVAGVTATAAAAYQSANLVFAQATPSPTHDIIGTIRPTLTPTPSLTLIPPPSERYYDEYVSVDYCPADTLFSMSRLPAGYDATGRILAPLQGDYLWAVEAEDGQRYEVTDIPACRASVDCELSPDNQWTLAQTYNEIYVVRPDGSDRRLLWDLSTPNPPTPVPYDLRWSGPNTLEWSGRVAIVQNGRTSFRDATLRDVLNVFPDPAPFYGIGSINGITTSLDSRQPGGPWAVGYTTYSTGIGEGYKYYLIQTETGETRLFAESQYRGISINWHPLGDRLYYGIPTADGEDTVWYELSMADGRHLQIGSDVSPFGDWSPDGSLVALYTDYEDYPLATWDYKTGTANFYCIPEDGDRGYSGGFWWSPDSKYLALRMPLPKDEDVEGVGEHILVVKLDTGEVVDLTAGMLDPYVWALDAGGYGDGVRVTPTPSPTPQPTATP